MNEHYNIYIQRQCDELHLGIYVALSSSMSLALLVWVGGGLLKRVVYFFGNEPS